MEAGCGSGTLAKHLTDAGHRVVGIDASAAMIRLARAHAPEARFRVESLETARVAPCDVVIAVGETITYLRSPRSVRQFFERVSRALTPGGLFLFDFIESAERRTYPPKSRAGDDWALVAEARLGRGRVLTRRITTFRKIGSTYRKSHEIHRVRIYSRTEIGAELDRCGFTWTMRRSFGRYRLMHSDVAVSARK